MFRFRGIHLGVNRLLQVFLKIISKVVIIANYSREVKKVKIKRVITVFDVITLFTIDRSLFEYRSDGIGKV